MQRIFYTEHIHRILFADTVRVYIHPLNKRQSVGKSAVLSAFFSTDSGLFSEYGINRLKWH